MSDPLPGPPVVEGTWQTVRSGHELIYLGGDRVLDWEPAKIGRASCRYNREATSGDPLPEPAVVEGTWQTVRSGHELIYLGGDRVLEWKPANFHCRICRYKREATSGDPLPGPAVVEGTWQSVRSGHELIYLGGDRVLDWEPA